MKITGLETASLPSGRAAIELQTDTGLAGLAIVNAGAVTAARALVREQLAGEDPRAAMGLWERMHSDLLNPLAPAVAHARAALDIAMWDLKAKANDEPLWKTLGGARRGARAHLAWDGPPDRRQRAEWLRRMRAETGIRCASLAASGERAEDLEALSDAAGILGASGPETSLLLRFDGTGWPGDVIRHVRGLERRFDLACVCSPVRPGDFAGARQVSDAIRAAVCIGRGLADARSFLPYLRHYAANIIELDLAVLGVSGCIRMADAAFGFELPVMLTAYPGPIPAHLFAALPTPMSVEIAYRDSVDPALVPDVTYEAGRVRAGMHPGHGLSIDRSAVATTGAPP